MIKYESADEGVCTMRFFISPTDYNWYEFLSDKSYDEVNFWRPGRSGFTALLPGELFVFKLKHERARSADEN